MSEIVKLRDKIEVTATGKNKYHKAGQKYLVHPKHVEYLEANGLIEKPKAKK